MMLLQFLVEMLSLASAIQYSANFTIIYDETHFQEDIAYLQTNGSSVMNNIQFVKVPTNGNLQNIAMATNGVDNQVLLFANNFALLNEAVVKHTTNVIKFGVSFEDMHSIVKNYPEEVCLHYNSLLVKSLTWLVYSIFVKSVAIVTDDMDCTLDFYRSLEKALEEADLNKRLHLDIKHVTYDFHGSQHDHHLPFYELKSINVGLIILLVPNHHINELLRAASQFSLLANSHIWLIPNYEEKLINRNLEPAHFVTLDDFNGPEGMSSFQRLRHSLPRIIEGYERFVNDCVTAYRPGFCLNSKLYSQIIEEEYEPFQDDFALVVRSKNMAGSDDGEWKYLDAKVDGDSVYVLNSNITMLTSSTYRKTYHTIRAVCISEEPYLYEDHLRYDSINDKCTTGMKCKGQNKVGGIEENTCCVGFLVDLIHLIKRDIKVDIDMYFVADGKYGAFNDGEWNGIMGDIVSGKADIAVAPVTITNDRLKYVQFTMPWLSTTLAFITKPQIVSMGLLNFEFLAPLGTYLQITFWMSILAVAIIIYIMDNTKSVYKIVTERKSEHKSRIDYYPFNESLAYISGVALQRDLGGENPRSKGSQFSSILFACGMVIFITTYTALLVQQGVYRQEKDPFTGSTDTRFRNPTPSYTFGTLASSSYVSFFHNSKEDVHRRVSNFMQDKNAPTVAEGVKAVSKGKLNAYMDEYSHLAWFTSNHHPCSLRVFRDRLMTFSLAFPAKKDFPWLSVFNEAILRSREGEELQKLHGKWFISGGCNIDGSEPYILQLGIANFGGLFFLVIVTTGICFTLLLPEHYYWRFIQEKFHSKLHGFINPGKNKDEEESEKLSQQPLMKKKSKILENDENNVKKGGALKFIRRLNKDGNSKSEMVESKNVGTML